MAAQDSRRARLLHACSSTDGTLTAAEVVRALSTGNGPLRRHTRTEPSRRLEPGPRPQQAPA